MPSPSTARRKRDVAERLHSAAIHLLRRVRDADAQSGLTPARLSALSVLVFGGPQTLTDLARAEGVRSPTMTGITQGLERDGLARRRRDPRDARAVLFEASARGERVLTAARHRRIDALERLLARASAGELLTLGEAAQIVERLTGV